MPSTCLARSRSIINRKDTGYGSQKEQVLALTRSLDVMISGPEQLSFHSEAQFLHLYNAVHYIVKGFFLMKL